MVRIHLFNYYAHNICPPDKLEDPIKNHIDAITKSEVGDHSKQNLYFPPKSVQGKKNVIGIQNLINSFFQRL